MTCIRATRRPGRRGFTLIELLVVIAILSILGSVLLTAVFSAGVRARVALASSQIKSLQTALEAYSTDSGFYPRDSRNVLGADIPHYLYAGLNNKPTTKLGGGTNAPYFDCDSSQIALLAGVDYHQPLDANGQPSGSASLPTDGEKNPISTTPLPQNANPSTASFQNQYASSYASAPANFDLSGVSNLPAFIDPWGNPYHYREWASKAELQKENLATGTQFDRVPHNFNSFDVWSNGPDGINNYGHPDADDVTNWGR